MTRQDDTFVALNYDALALYDNECQGIVCLTDRDKSVILSCLRYVTWRSRWFGSDGKLLRDTGRLADLQEALDYGEALLSKIAECA